MNKLDELFIQTFKNIKIDETTTPDGRTEYAIYRLTKLENGKISQSAIKKDTLIKMVKDYQDALINELSRKWGFQYGTYG